MTALDEGSSTGSFIKLPIRASQNSLGACVGRVGEISNRTKYHENNNKPTDIELAVITGEVPFDKISVPHYCSI